MVLSAFIVRRFKVLRYSIHSTVSMLCPRGCVNGQLFGENKRVFREQICILIYKFDKCNFDSLPCTLQDIVISMTINCLYLCINMINYTNNIQNTGEILPHVVGPFEWRHGVTDSSGTFVQKCYFVSSTVSADGLQWGPHSGLVYSGSILEG